VHQSPAVRLDKIGQTGNLHFTPCRVAFASVEEKDLFQQRVNDYRRLLRVGSSGNISALGDGAEWIWNIICDVFGKVRECLDVYHALENLSKTGKVLYGEGTEEYKQW
jgi:hypothetical protein